VNIIFPGGMDMRQILALVVLAFYVFGSPWQVCAKVLSPKGEKKDYLGDIIFFSKKMEVEQVGDKGIIRIWTNYNVQSVGYDVADVWAEVNNISFSVEIKPRLGIIRLNPEWITSQSLEKSGRYYGRRVNGDFIPVQAIGGKLLSIKADIKIFNLWSEYLILITLPAEFFDFLGISGPFKIRAGWATASCGNSEVTGEGNFLINAPDTPWGGGCPGTSPVILSHSTPAPVFWPESGGFAGGWIGGGGSCGWDGKEYPQCHRKDKPPCPPPVVTPIPGGLFLWGGLGGWLGAVRAMKKLLRS
jgi:hypothetical protein